MPNISEIRTTTFRIPMRGVLRWGKAGRLDVLEHFLVQVILDSGHVGFAEAPPRPTIFGETPESIHAIIKQYLAPAIVGLSAEDFNLINKSMNAIANNNTAKGAIDMALYEAVAAWKGNSLLEYLNPPQRNVKVSYILGLSDLETMVSDAKSAYEQGVRVLKVKIGRSFEQDLNVIQALQSEFASTDLQLYGDANEGLSPHQALSQLKLLHELGLMYV